MIEQGKKAPAFSLPDQDGKIHKLSDCQGQWVLLYFYPKDDTPGCTKEACGIRDSWPAFKKLSIQVFGVSADSPKSHTKFADKYKLPFTLLADEEKTVSTKYGAWGEKKMMGRTYMGMNRISYLIDPKGNVAKVYKTVKPPEHAQQVLNDLKKLMV
jgi:thioredoxin-dependent peroxiredoxin